MSRFIALVLVSLAVVAACGRHRQPEPIGDASAPRLGWVIMHGSSENPDEEFACQSNPRTTCTLPVSTPDRRVFSEVHLYLHPTGVRTRYAGTMQVEFFGGRPTPLDVIVEPRNIGNDSVVGIVSDKPGEYAFDVAVTANTPAGPIQVSDRVSVTVK